MKAKNAGIGRRVIVKDSAVPVAARGRHGEIVQQLDPEDIWQVYVRLDDPLEAWGQAVWFSYDELKLESK